MFELFTDTSANLPGDWIEREHVRVIPFTFCCNGVECVCTDTREFDGGAFFKSMREGAVVTTSQVTPHRYEEAMRPVLEQGRDVLFVGMSSGVSGSYASAKMAAAQLKASFPERRICLVDTLGASLGEGLLVMRAAQMRECGLDADETALRLDRLRMSMCQVFTVEDLRYLSRTGRISNVKAVLGNLLQIKPILKGNTRGEIVRIAQIRGRRAAVEELARHYIEGAVHPETQTIGIAHADCPGDAQLLESIIREKRPPRDILTVVYEPVTGSHVGPGTLALFYMGEKSFRE